MSTNYKFSQAKNKLITEATRIAGAYLLTKYGSAHMTGEPKVELTHTEGPVADSYSFTGKITVQADAEMGKGFSTLDVNMTVNENNIEVESDDIQANIVEALNAQQEAAPVVASLDAFQLTDDGSKYLKVSHPALEEANLGVVGKNEFAASPDKAELLKTIVTDSLARTASYTKINFTGEFKEPVISKIAAETVVEKAKIYMCPGCNSEQEEFGSTGKCMNCARELPKKSWLTDTEPPMAGAEFMEYMCPVCKESFEEYDVNLHDKACPGTPEVMADKPAISISEDMPMARMSDHMAQASQLEEQLVSIAEEKIKLQAANAIVGMLQSLGYGSSRIAEVTVSKEGLDVMTYLEDAGTTKAVNIPVTLKDAVVVLPKRSLVSTLISKGLDVKARLSEEFSKEILERIATIEERVAYEQKEAQDILNEKSVVTKQASGSDNMQTLGDNETLELQKHLIPGHEDLKKGDKVSDGFSQWEIVDTEGHQNDKNEGSSSIWKLRKCAPAKSDDKEPETKLSI